MTDSLNFLRYQPQGIDWDKHDPATERKRLAASAHAADHRRLQQGARNFLPSEYLVNAVNAAIATRSPLLLTGDPGTGKTQVAYYLEQYFGIPLFHYQVHSDSSARDLRYDFDAVAYLRDAYLASLHLEQSDTEPAAPPERTDPRYLHKGKLWLAYEHPGEYVLLINEIDKAPRDFPNDLLQELADYCFDHPFPSDPPNPPIERGDRPPPIVIITSNGERRLPDPFLRRCIVHHIELDEELLTRILGAWEGEFAERLSPPVQKQAFRRFLELRRRLEKRSRPPPGAAELLIWLTILAAQGAELKQLQDEVPLAELPALEGLIKDHENYAHLR